MSSFQYVSSYLPIVLSLRRFTTAVFTRDTFTCGKLTFLLYCVTFSIVKWHLHHVNVSRVNTAYVKNETYLAFIYVYRLVVSKISVICARMFDTLKLPGTFVFLSPRWMLWEWLTSWTAVSSAGSQFNTRSSHATNGKSSSIHIDHTKTVWVNNSFRFCLTNARGFKVLPNKYMTTAYQMFMLHADSWALIPGLALCCQDSLFFLSTKMPNARRTNVQNSRPRF